ncbi:MAG TPA: YdeI/OmpD-associated family protein [Bryobacteraceae bacterium]|nr:YdeI/OmpD-associated family protein [Bryobacteraceae bacterium]
MTKPFQATLERTKSRLNWVIARVPAVVSKTFGTRAQLRVKGAINGFPFRTSLFPTGTGEHVILVNNRMLVGAKTGVGEAAEFRLEPDTEERKIVVPAELASALAEDRALRRWFDGINDSTRRFIVSGVAGVKSAEARKRKAGQVAEWMLEAMEAERELPPMLRTAFARKPQAYEGWKSMPASRRRAHLLGIFYYRSPGARTRRMARMLKEAYERAEKRRDHE